MAARWRSISSIESPPNFSRNASASTNDDHRFADDGRRRHRADVAALDGGRRVLQRVQVHRSQRLHQRGDRLHEPGDAHVLAVGDAAFEAAGIVGRPDRKIGVMRRRQDLVVDARAGAERDLRADADADGLDGVNAHHRLREPAIELAIPLHVGAEAGRDAGGDHFERAAERVAGLFGGIDGRNHLLLQFRIGAAQRDRRAAPALRRR